MTIRTFSLPHQRSAKNWLLFALTLLLMSTNLIGRNIIETRAASGTAISLTNLGQAYTQDFNTLAITGTSSTLPTGWAFTESGTSANSTYTAGTGSSTTGDTYSFGAASDTDRALGGLQSGSLIPTIGACFANNTGSTITSLAIMYTGEQWRSGETGRTDRLDFQYSLDATSLTTGTWTNVDTLDFTTLNTASIGAKDGNATANRATITLTITSLTIVNGATFYIRWNDFNATGSDDGLAIDDFSLTPTAPTAVQMIELSAQVKATPSSRPAHSKGVLRGAVINWRTGFEVDNLGFNIYRDEQGQRIKLNPSLIAGSALFAGASTPLTAGQSYVWSDSAGDQGARYWLEEIDLSGTSVWHGPVTATQIANNPLPNRSEKALLLEDLNVGANATPQREFALAEMDDLGTLRASAPEQKAWVTPNQSAVKLPVRRAGWYRVTRQELAATGFNANVNPDSLQLLADGVEVPMRVVNATPGQFVTGDFIEFYGAGVDAQSTDTRVYWLVAGTTPGLRILTATSRDTAATVNSFVSTVERKDRLIYLSGLLNGATENWFGPVINTAGATQLLTTRFVEHVTGAPAILEAVLQGVTQQAHTVEITVNGTTVGSASFANKDRVVRRFEVAASLLLDGDNAVVFKSTSGGSDISLVEAVRLSYARKYLTDDNPFSFSVTAGQTAYISGFRTPSVRVLQLGNGGALREISVRVQPQNGSYGFVLQSESDATYVAYPTARFDRVLGATQNLPSNWRDVSKAAQFLIVTHKDFAASAQRLAQARQQQGWQVAVVDVEDAYDEFAFGAHSPQAIKDLLAYARTNWTRSPSHVLLIGDASTDPRNYLELGNVDFLPTYLGATAYFETALDNWLADTDNDGLPELSLGRLPVRSAAQADAVVTKLLSATFNPANRSGVFVSDRVVEGFDFRAISQQLAGVLPTGLSRQHINRMDGTPDAVRASVIQAINAPGNSPLVVNWLGHGSTQVWTGDGLLRTQDVPALANSLPALFTMTTCLNGYFVDPTQVSLGEAVLTNSPSGAFAVVAATALNQPSTQISFNQQLYQGLFTRGLTLGEALKVAREGVADQDVRNSYVLFGDPTMRLTVSGSRKE